MNIQTDEEFRPRLIPLEQHEADLQRLTIRMVEALVIGIGFPVLFTILAFGRGM